MSHPRAWQDSVMLFNTFVIQPLKSPHLCAVIPLPAVPLWFMSYWLGSSVSLDTSTVNMLSSSGPSQVGYLRACQATHLHLSSRHSGSGSQNHQLTGKNVSGHLSHGADPFHLGLKLKTMPPPPPALCGWPSVTKCSDGKVEERDRDNSLSPLQTTEVCLYRGTLGGSVDHSTHAYRSWVLTYQLTLVVSGRTFPRGINPGFG